MTLLTLLWRLPSWWSQDNWNKALYTGEEAVWLIYILLTAIPWKHPIQGKEKKYIDPKLDPVTDGLIQANRGKDRHQIRHRDAIRDRDRYSCVCVRTRMCSRREGGWGGIDMMMRERSCSNGVPHIRWRPALFNVLQIALPSALWTPTAHQRNSHRWIDNSKTDWRLNNEEA